MDGLMQQYYHHSVPKASKKDNNTWWPEPSTPARTTSWGLFRCHFAHPFERCGVRQAGIDPLCRSSMWSQYRSSVAADAAALRVTPAEIDCWSFSLVRPTTRAPALSAIVGEGTDTAGGERADMSVCRELPF